MLCLHGRGSNNDVSELQLMNLRMPGVACDFFQGRIECPPQSPLLPMFCTQQHFYSWIDDENPMKSLHQSFAEIMEVVETRGPFDGIYGFSQGGAVVAMLSNEMVWKGLLGGSSCPWSFVVCACAVAPAYAQHLWPSSSSPALPDGPDALPLSSLHIMGQQDPLLPSSRAVQAAFDPDQAFSHVHASGHELPMTLCRDQDLTQTLEAFCTAQRSILRGGIRQGSEAE